MRKPITLFAVSVLAAASFSASATIDKPECIVGAKPGGGFDLTCKLAQQSLLDQKIMKEPMRATYMPGGIGAVAMNTVVAQRAARPQRDRRLLGRVAPQHRAGQVRQVDRERREVARRGRHRLRLHLGRQERAVEEPRRRSPRPSRPIPAKVPMGGGGTVGSQDWTKAALFAKKIGVDPKAMRWVSFEGNGEATTALMGGHIAGDVRRRLRRRGAGRGRQHPHDRGPLRQAARGQARARLHRQGAGLRHPVADHPRLLHGARRFPTPTTRPGRT